MGIKQFHLVCTFIFWCLFSFLIKYSETSLGGVVILPLVMIGQLQLTFSGLKQVIHDQAIQYGYQTVPFCVYIHNLMFSIVVFVYSPLLKSLESCHVTMCFGNTGRSLLCCQMQELPPSTLSMPPSQMLAGQRLRQSMSWWSTWTHHLPCRVAEVQDSVYISPDSLSLVEVAPFLFCLWKADSNWLL